MLNEALCQRTTEEWLREFDAIGLPCGPLNDIPQAAEQPQVKARDMLVEVEHPELGSIPLPGVTIKLSETPGEIRLPPPLVGEHNEEIYCELLGHAPEELAVWKEEGVI